MGSPRPANICWLKRIEGFKHYEVPGLEEFMLTHPMTIVDVLDGKARLCTVSSWCPLVMVSADMFG